MTTSAETVSNLRATWAGLGKLSRSLTVDQWSSPSLCPAWTAQGVIAHAASIEQVLLGWKPGGDSPFSAVVETHAEFSAMSPDDLVIRFREIVTGRLAELESMTEDDFATVGFTPVGPQTYGRFMAIRCFDNWVHERDIRVPLAIPGDDGGPAAVMALDEVHNSLGFIVGKKVGLTDGRSLAVELTGPVVRRMCVKVDGRAAVVPTLDNPDATLITDSLTFMLLACGRIDPDDPIADGRMTWIGDSELGERAARNLRFTM